MKEGGCITRQWSQTLEVSEQVVDLLAREPKLAARFERLHDKHDRSMPRVLGWGDTHMSVDHMDPHRTASILTQCVRGRGLLSSCWYVSDRRRGRKR